MSRRCHLEGHYHQQVVTIYQIDDAYACAIENARPFEELDPRDHEQNVELPKNLLLIILDEAKPHQVLKIGVNISLMEKTQLVVFLKELKDVFA